MKNIRLSFQRYVPRKQIHQAISILRTHYWQLIFDIGVNNKFKKYKPPEIRLLHQDENWKEFDIEGFHFFWPVEYGHTGLGWIYRETFAPYDINPHAYETDKIKIHERDWVIDGGACEGFFTHYALQNKANVVAIEPVPRLAEALKLTFQNEIKTGRVIVINAGLGRNNGTSQLQVNSNDIFSSSISSGKGLTVPSVSLDDILRVNMIPKIDFIKMDIEGAEIDAILGAINVLRKQPKLSIAVYHSYENAKTLKGIIKEQQCHYHISYRGVFIKEEFGAPRPFMLYAN